MLLAHACGLVAVVAVGVAVALEAAAAAAAALVISSSTGELLIETPISGVAQEPSGHWKEKKKIPLASKAAIICRDLLSRLQQI